MASKTTRKLFPPTYTVRILMYFYFTDSKPENHGLLEIVRESFQCEIEKSKQIGKKNVLWGNKKGKKEDKQKSVINIVKDIRASFYKKEQSEDKKVLRN